MLRMAGTRTTLTLEPDVQRLIDAEVHRARKTFKEVVNDAIRRGLAPNRGAHARAKRYRVTPHASKLRAGVDVTSLNRLVDELEGDAALRRSVRSK